ncbi:MAG: TraR/DksA family transcriptional regulator [Pseudomonadota bacterium]
MALTRDQLQQLSRILAERHASFTSGIREDVERSREETFGELAGAVRDTGDEAAADLLADLDQAEVARDVRELRDLEAARSRLERGEYGICTDCGGEISFERLLAYPTAKRCLDCQRVHERTHMQHSS